MREKRKARERTLEPCFLATTAKIEIGLRVELRYQHIDALPAPKDVDAVYFVFAVCRLGVHGLGEDRERLAASIAKDFIAIAVWMVDGFARPVPCEKGSFKHRVDRRF